MLTHAPKEIFTQLGLAHSNMGIKDISYNDLPRGAQVVKKATPIFPRLEVEEEVSYIQSKMTKNEKAKGRKAMAEAAKQKNEESANSVEEAELNLTKKEIRFDKFDKVELKSAEILAVSHVEGADKLLKFSLDAGDKAPRQILSGIAKWYPNPEELVGKKVIIVANLQPRKMRGELSQGMLLSAEYGDKVELLTVSEAIPNGSLIG